MPDAGNATRPARGVLLAPARAGWPQDLLSVISREGYLLVPIDDLRLIPYFVLTGGIAAVVVDADALQPSASLALQESRGLSPAVAIVAIAMEPSPKPQAVKRALESGATAFVSWPVDPEIVANALRRVP